jgi:4-hydroxy-3-methylbut-2-enyl diphosphate reductase
MSATAAANFVPGGAFLVASSGKAVSGGFPASWPITVVSQAVFPRTAASSAPLSSNGLGSLALGVGIGFLAVGASGQRRRRRVGQHQRATAVANEHAVVAEAPLKETVLPHVDRSATKAFRKEFMQSDQYFRFSRTQMDEAMAGLKDSSGSDLVKRIRENGSRLTIGDVTFVLAESYGFCWGVERTLAMAYEAHRFFPDKTIWLTNEIIHNAVVNKDLEKLGMRFVPKTESGGKDFACIQSGDVCVLPAFGASIDEMALLKSRNVQVVDTTCPWVSKVWNSVEKAKGKQHTTIIHGKYAHEETVATKSFADKYIVVKDIHEAEYVANYVLGQGDREEFLAKFSYAISEGFDPDSDLEKVGVANQTTMLKGETELIGRLFERVMIRKFGPQTANDHFLSFNTICDATQERQNAIYKMFDAKYEQPASKLYAELEGEQVGIELKAKSREKQNLSSKVQEARLRGEGTPVDAQPVGHVDLGLVVGGFNSSNTLHLVEIPEELGVKTYHIDCAARVGGAGTDGIANVIQHKPLSTPSSTAMLDQGLEVTEGFLPDGPVVIGVTAGASTPDSSVGECLARVLAVRGLTP